MRKLATLLLTILLMFSAMSAMAENVPTFEMLGSELNIQMMLGPSDNDYLFYHSYTKGSNLADRLVYNKDGNAVFVTHGGDAQLHISYIPSDDGFIINRIVFYAIAPMTAGNELLEAMTVLALELDMVELGLDRKTFMVVDTTDQFTSKFRTGLPFTMNGITVTNTITYLKDTVSFVTVFEGINHKVY